MEEKQFMSVVDKILNEVKETLSRKSAEYAAPDEQFHNFDLVAELLGCDREGAIFALMTKHIVSLRDAAMRYVLLDEDKIREKVIDLIAYSLLLYAAMQEGRNGGISR